MHKRTIALALALGAFLCASQPFLRAQDAKPETKQETNPAGPHPATAYRLEIAINEFADGKKVNTRRYTINTMSFSNMNGGSPQQLRIGSRVPVQNEEGKFTYLDVGTYILAGIQSWSTPMALHLSADITSLASPEESTHGGHPLLRQMRIEGTVPMITDKPIVVGTVDDPNSNREFQLEVTVVKLP
jgi:hypothetical protein